MCVGVDDGNGLGVGAGKIGADGDSESLRVSERAAVGGGVNDGCACVVSLDSRGGAGC